MIWGSGGSSARQADLGLDPPHHARVLADPPGDHELGLHVHLAQQGVDAGGDRLVQPGEDLPAVAALSHQRRHLGLGEHRTGVADAHLVGRLE